MKKVSSIVTLSLVSSLALVAAGCDRDKETAATTTDASEEQRYDSTVAESEQSEHSTRDLGATLEQKADQAGQAIDDVAITTTIKGKYLADTTLKGLDINVDTDQGVVMLTGTVENQAARDHATEIAKGVDGVVSVNNELKVN